MAHNWIHSYYLISLISDGHWLSNNSINRLQPQWRSRSGQQMAIWRHAWRRYIAQKHNPLHWSHQFQANDMHCMWHDHLLEAGNSMAQHQLLIAGILSIEQVRIITSVNSKQEDHGRSAARSAATSSPRHKYCLAQQSTAWKTQ